MPSVFKKYEGKIYPYNFKGELLVKTIAGGIPSDPKVAEGWIKSKLAPSDDLVRSMVAEIMAERGVDADEAAKIASAYKNLNGFKRTENGELYIEGRQLKAAIKEAASVAVASGALAQRGWGKTNKGCLSFIAEHVFVVEDILPLGVKEATGITQRFVSTWRGTGIQYEEYVENARIEFSITSDFDFAEKDWAAIWLTGQNQGIGATRSQGFGRYEVTKWEKVK